MLIYLVYGALRGTGEEQLTLIARNSRMREELDRPVQVCPQRRRFRLRNESTTRDP